MSESSVDAVVKHEIAVEQVHPSISLQPTSSSEDGNSTLKPNATETSTITSESKIEPLLPGTRDDCARARETKGEALFRVVWNDGNPDHLIALTGAKNIFAAQLPKMPKEYIARLVFNREHRTMCIITPKGVIGGICFRPFYEQKFAEIVFCAIMSTEQVKGYGTRIMNHLKEHVKTEGIEYFLTYADNYATGYFKKQGFSKVLSMTNDRWKGYVKDYDGGTLMECRISKPINYLNVRDTLKQQREAVYRRIQQISKTHILYPGLTFPFASEEELRESPQKRRYLDIASIPGVLEAGWNSSLQKKRTAQSLSSAEHAQMNLTARLMSVLKSLLEVKDSWPFKKPVDKSLVLDYYDVIKEPMDFGTISSRLASGYYSTREQFEYDIKLIVKNCQAYNASSTTYYRCSLVVETTFVALMKMQFPDDSPSSSNSMTDASTGSEKQILS